MDVRDLTIGRAIVHDVPQRAPIDVRREHPERDTAPRLSEVEAPLDDDVRDYMERRIVASMGRIAYEMRFIPGSASPTPDLVTTLLGGASSNVVEVSQDLARALHGSQPTSASAGLLVVVTGTWDQSPFAGLLKLERERGVRLQERTIEGKATFDAVLERDLLLTEGIKVFKVGLFRLIGDVDAERSVEAWVSDEQTGLKRGVAVAQFFREQFLGCDFVEQADLATKRFFEAVETWANREVGDAADRTAIELALVTEMNSQADTVLPRRFITTHVPPRHRQALRTHLEEAGVALDPFVRDTSLITARVRQVQYRFQSGVRVLAAPEQFDNGVVHQEELDDGRLRVKVEDRLTRIHGA